MSTESSIGVRPLDSIRPITASAATSSGQPRATLATASQTTWPARNSGSWIDEPGDVRHRQHQGELRGHPDQPAVLGPAGRIADRGADDEADQRPADHHGEQRQHAPARRCRGCRAGRRPRRGRSGWRPRRRSRSGTTAWSHVLSDWRCTSRTTPRIDGDAQRGAESRVELAAGTQATVKPTNGSAPRASRARRRGTAPAGSGRTPRRSGTRGAGRWWRGGPAHEAAGVGSSS